MLSMNLYKNISRNLTVCNAHTSRTQILSIMAKTQQLLKNIQSFNYEKKISLNNMIVVWMNEPNTMGTQTLGKILQ